MVGVTQGWRQAMGHIMDAMTRLMARSGNAKVIDWEQFFRMQQRHDQRMRDQQKKRAMEKL